MAGCSGTPLPKKLGIKPGSRVAVIDAPRGTMPVIAELAATGPIDLKLTGRAPYDVILLFCENLWSLNGRFAQARDRMAQTGGLWIAWPKKSSGIETDLNENIVRDLALAAGLVDNKVCAIDGTWSGLRLVIRLENRIAPFDTPPKRGGTEHEPKQDRAH
ncbi:MAG: hypothetical protein KF678_00255 [Phycisphaeraceae bacterium]|nr:hypothetical protein [Phycisphaeraceae bacterium]